MKLLFSFKTEQTPPKTQGTPMLILFLFVSRAIKEGDLIKYLVSGIGLRTEYIIKHLLHCFIDWRRLKKFRPALLRSDKKKET